MKLTSAETVPAMDLFSWVLDAFIPMIHTAFTDVSFAQLQSTNQIVVFVS